MEQKRLTKTLILIVIILILITAYSVYSVFKLSNKIDGAEQNAIVKELMIKDSVKNVETQIILKKIDSLIEVHESEIRYLQRKDKDLQNRIDGINSDVGELPDFGTN